MVKKILFVITKSNFGGAQRYVYDLATRLPSDQFEVSVAFGHAPETSSVRGRAGQLSRMLIERDIRTIVISELTRDVGFLRDWQALNALIGLMRIETPDIVHVNSSKAGGLGAFAARLCGVSRIIFTIHGLPADEDRSAFSRAFISFFTWLTIMLSHRTIVVSSDALARVRRFPFAYNKVSLVFNGIEAPSFESAVQARAALRTIDPSIPEEGTLVGTIAELHPNKDLKTAIAALSHMPHGHLAIIGDGEMREELRMYAQEINVHDRVHFLGHVADAAKYLLAFDAFLLTSIKEGLPYVLLEAAAAELPIVAVDIPGARDVVLPDFTGVLVAREASKIAAALGKVLRDHTFAKSLTNAMTTRLRATFSLPHMLEKTRALYDA